MDFIPKLVSETPFDNGDVMKKYADGSYYRYNKYGELVESRISSGDIEIHTEEEYFEWNSEYEFGVLKRVKIIYYICSDGRMSATQDGRLIMKRQANGCFKLYTIDGIIYEENERPIGGAFKKYYLNGNVRFCATDNGWTEYDEDGEVIAQGKDE